MKLPCKPKYVDEAIPDYWALCNTDGTWNVVHSNDIFKDVFINLTKDQAEEIVRIQLEFKLHLYEYMCKEGP